MAGNPVCGRKVLTHKLLPVPQAAVLAYRHAQLLTFRPLNRIEKTTALSSSFDFRVLTTSSFFWREMAFVTYGQNARQC